MTTYKCKACEWSGWLPENLWLEKRVGDSLSVKAIPICPECGNDVKVFKDPK